MLHEQRQQLAALLREIGLSDAEIEFALAGIALAFARSQHKRARDQAVAALEDALNDTASPDVAAAIDSAIDTLMSAEY